VEKAQLGGKGISKIRIFTQANHTVRLFFHMFSAQIFKFPPHKNTFPGGEVAAKRTDEGTSSPCRGTDFPNFGIVPRAIDNRPYEIRNLEVFTESVPVSPTNIPLSVKTPRKIAHIVVSCSNTTNIFLRKYCETVPSVVHFMLQRYVGLKVPENAVRNPIFEKRGLL
jgi:hypothetical protein